MQLVESGHAARAIQYLRGRLSESPDEGRLWELLGELAHRQGDSRLAIDAFERAALLVPLHTESQLALARCYESAGHRATSAAIYGFLSDDPRLEAETLEPLAAGLGRCGDHERALGVCRRAADQMPENPQPLMGMVHYMRRLRRPVETIIPVAFRAHRLAPDDPEYRITLAWMLHEVGRTEEGARLIDAMQCEAFSCIRCLSLMQHIFERVGDETNATVCRTRLMVLASTRQSDGFTTNDD